MRWTLSSAAAPEASLKWLLEAAARKSLAGVELVRGHGHGIEPGPAADSLDVVRAAFRDSGLEFAAYRIQDATDLDPEETAVFAHALGAPVVLATAGGMEEASLEGWARSFEERRSALLLALEDPAALDSRWSAAVARRHPDTVGVAWDATSASGTGDQARWMLEAFGSSVGCARIPGTGPESLRDDDGRIGSLVTVMTLLGYRGPAVLAPSSARRLDEWREWLGRRRGWGCGGARRPEEATPGTSTGGPP